MRFMESLDIHVRSTYEPSLSGSSAIRRFKHSHAIEIRDGITDFYTGLPHMLSYNWHKVHCSRKS